MSTSRKILVVLLVLVIAVFVVGGSIVLVNSRNSADSKCQDFIQQLNDGNTTASYNLLSPQAQSSEPQSGWSQKVSSLKNSYGAVSLSSKTIVPALGSTQSSTIRLEYKITGQSSYTFECLAVKTGQGYRVDSFLSTPKQ